MGSQEHSHPAGVLRIWEGLRPPHDRKASINCAEGITASEEQRPCPVGSQPSLRRQVDFGTFKNIIIRDEPAHSCHYSRRFVQQQPEPGQAVVPG